jgi:hypothetical protein
VEETVPQLHYSLWLGQLLIALILFGVSRLIGVRSLATIYRENFPRTIRERVFCPMFGRLLQ